MRLRILVTTLIRLGSVNNHLVVMRRRRLHIYSQLSPVQENNCPVRLESGIEFKSMESNYV